MTTSEQDLALSIELPGRVLSGFPVWAGVTVANLTDDTTLCEVPGCTPLSPAPPLDLVFRSPTGERREVHAGHEHLEGVPDGEPLGPREIRRTTADLSEAIGALAPGPWWLEARIDALGVAAPEVAFEVTRPTPEDAAVAARLARRNELDEPGWPWLLIASPGMIEAEELEGLGEEGRAALALWLFLHEATWGEAPPGALDPGQLFALDDAESALLRHEIFCAKGLPAAEGLAAAIHERWPGLEERLAENAAGQGFLSTLRRFYGAAAVR